jgi:hypothetical protein
MARYRRAVYGGDETLILAIACAGARTAYGPRVVNFGRGRDE